MVLNWPELAFHTQERLRSQVRRIGKHDAKLNALLDRAENYLRGHEHPRGRFEGPTLTTQLQLGEERVNTVTTIAAFSGAGELLVDDLRVEMVFPADAAAEDWFREAAEH